MLKMLKYNNLKVNCINCNQQESVWLRLIDDNNNKKKNSEE